EVDRDVLSLRDHLASPVEKRSGRISAFLDVRRVGRPHEHRAHLLAGRPQRTGQHLGRDGIEAFAHLRRSRNSVPSSRTPARQPGGTTTVASDNSQIAGPSSRSPGAGSPLTTFARSLSPPNTASRALLTTLPFRSPSI